MRHSLSSSKAFSLSIFAYFTAETETICQRKSCLANDSHAYKALVGIVPSRLALLTVRQPLPLFVVLQVWVLHGAAVVNDWFGVLQSRHELSVLVLTRMPFGKRVEERHRSV